MDIYGTFEKACYDSIIALAGDAKPIALAEVGAMPSLETLAAQPRWSYMMMWSGMAESSNGPDQLQAAFHAPNIVNRGDARLPAPLPPPSVPQPSDPEVTAAAKVLLMKFSSAKSTGAEVAEFNLDGSSSTVPITEIRAAVKAGHLPVLRWMPQSPTGEGLAGPLTDFEWSELLKSGTPLHEKWLAEIDAIVPLLHRLDEEHIAVAWSPLPEPNARKFWWGSRPGPEGSRALFQELAERLTSQDRLHSLVWTWEPAMAASAAGTPRPVPLDDFYPGPLGIDAITLDVEGDSAVHGFAPREVEALAGVKPVGIRSTIPLADPTLLASFSWAYTAAPLPPSAH